MDVTNGIRTKVTALGPIWAQHGFRNQEDGKKNQSNDFVCGCMRMMDKGNKLSEWASKERKR